MPSEILHTLNQGIRGINYGILPTNFKFNLQTGYTVLAGKNDTGKSTILQFIFKEIYTKSEESRTSTCLISSKRSQISPNMQPGQEKLDQYNHALYDLIKHNPLTHDTNNLNTQDLSKLFLHKTDLREQLTIIDKYLNRLDFPSTKLMGPQEIIIEDIHIHLHGAGLIAVFPILSALTSSDITTILIDEPELSLEARAQKELKNIILEASDAGKNIIVATQSHLFLDKRTENIDNNYIVFKKNNQINIEKISSEDELLDLTYNLLGNSLEDLFFPNNFLVVEGASDQCICEKIAKLLNIGSNKVKIISATGIDNVSNISQAIENTLKPVITKNSPYSKKIVALIDNCSNKNKEKLNKYLTDRLFTLSENSIEEYIPESIYLKANRDKKEDIKKIEALKNNYSELKKIKSNISESIAAILDDTDLEQLTIIVDALKKANQ